LPLWACPTQPGTYTFKYFSQSRLATYQCRLNKDGVPGTWAQCNGQSVREGPLSPGSYSFDVRGTDEFGSRDLSPAARSFDIAGHPGELVRWATRGYACPSCSEGGLSWGGAGGCGGEVPADGVAGGGRGITEGEATAPPVSGVRRHRVPSHQ
jgi:hypothetical protein